MMFPTLKTNAPNNHPMIRIIAMTYNRSLMILFLVHVLIEKRVPRQEESQQYILGPLSSGPSQVRPLNVENLTEYVDKINLENRLLSNAAFGIIFLRASA